MATQNNSARGKKAPKVKQMELPNATQEVVVVRFPPEPSGYLHIGHAKAALLNDHFAHVQYPGGTFILRFDDTNTEKENEEFQNSIQDDVKLLGISPDQVSHTSDYFEHLEQYCCNMIRAGKAYADDTPADKMKEMRRARLPSERRDATIDDSLEKFELMRTSAEGAEWCIRAKISHASDNTFLRDPVIYRCTQKPHHRTGTKYRAYPTYQFACPIVDSLEGITHALRTNEYDEQNALYKWILKALDLRAPYIWTFSKIQFVRTLMSKRKLTKLVNAGVVAGWDDPRLPTIRGIKRHGMTIEALRDFMISQGPSKNVVCLDWHTIWTTNKKVIDTHASRYTAIGQGHATCQISGVEVFSSEKPKHAKYDLGMKEVVYGPRILLEHDDAVSLEVGEEITLMNWGNVIVRHKNDATQGEGDQHNSALHVEFELHLEGDVKKTKKKLTWLSTDQDLVSIELVDFDHLLTKDKLTDEEEDRWEAFLNQTSETTVEALADCNVREIKIDDILQFDRKGYYRCDRAATQDTPGRFFKIPSGKE